MHIPDVEYSGGFSEFAISAKAARSLLSPWESRRSVRLSNRAVPYRKSTVITASDKLLALTVELELSE